MRPYLKYIGRTVKVKPEANGVWSQYGAGTIIDCNDIYYIIRFVAFGDEISSGFTPEALLILRTKDDR